MNVILSIHPKWANLIYEGKKTVEWRKNQPLYSKFEFHEINKVFIYETAPVRKITGFVKINGFFNFNANKEAYYNRRNPVYDLFIKEGCVAPEDLLKYQGKSENLIAWQIRKSHKFITPKSLEDFGLERPPQSWCYTEVNV